MFQANTNASLKILETRIGQLALNMQKQSKDLVLNDTRKDPRECMAVLLRSGRNLDARRVEKDTEDGKYADFGEELKQHSSETTEEEKTARMQQEQQVEEENPGK